jgi:hypothetical protein
VRRVGSAGYYGAYASIQIDQRPGAVLDETVETGASLDVLTLARFSPFRLA